MVHQPKIIRIFIFKKLYFQIFICFQQYTHTIQAYYLMFGRNPPPLPLIWSNITFDSSVSVDILRKQMLLDIQKVRSKTAEVTQKAQQQI